MSQYLTREMYDSLRAVATLGHRRQVEILEINENRNKRQLSVSTAVNYMYPIYNAYTTFASLTGEAEKLNWLNCG